MNYKYKDFKHNQFCTCMIYSTKITDAKISINKNGEVYICQNKVLGADASNILGYKYSWRILDKDQDFIEESSGYVNNLKLFQ